MVLKNLFIWQEWRKRHREQTYGQEKSRGKGELYGKNNIETQTTMYKIDNQQEFALSLRKFKQY